MTPQEVGVNPASGNESVEEAISFERSLDLLMTDEGERFLASVPYAKHLTNPREPLNESYYLRHRIETIKRIRLTSRVDALALAALINEDYEAARSWARYVAEELDHDRLFIHDLECHGYTRKYVDEIEPFPSTKALIDFLLQRTRDLGALPAVAYSVFVEWNSERYSRSAVEKARAAYSAKHVAGSSAHCEIDEDEDHYAMLVNIAHALVKKRGSAEELFSVITEISNFFRAYFRELYASTIGMVRVADA